MTMNELIVVICGGVVGGGSEEGYSCAADRMHDQVRNRVSVTLQRVTG